MHPVNNLLSFLGVRLIQTEKSTIPREFIKKFKQQKKQCLENDRGFEVYDQLVYEAGDHPSSFTDFQCAFAAQCLSDAKPQNILDIGSYRTFVLGLLANYKVTTVDVRKRKPASDNETVVTCDAKTLDLPDESFDAVVSLCALEHFGLGRYGDDFDLDGDKKAFAEMVRVLSPGGLLIFSTTVTGASPCIAFNAHRIYSPKMVREFCTGLKVEKEEFFSQEKGLACSVEELTKEPAVWDGYCGLWKKTK